MANPMEEIMALVTLECRCVYLCQDGPKGATGLLLPKGEENSVKDNCRGCNSLGMKEIIVFNPVKGD